MSNMNKMNSMAKDSLITKGALTVRPGAGGFASMHRTIGDDLNTDRQRINENSALD